MQLRRQRGYEDLRSESKGKQVPSEVPARSAEADNGSRPTPAAVSSSASALQNWGRTPLQPELRRLRINSPSGTRQSSTVAPTSYTGPKVIQSTMPHIHIKYDETFECDFPGKVNKALEKIHEGETGRRLIEELKPFAEDGKYVSIKRTMAMTNATPILTKSQEAKYGIDEDKVIASNDKASKLAQKTALSSGTGTAVEIRWNPIIGLVLNKDGAPIATNNAEKSYLALAHELVHARRIVKGTYTGAVGSKYDPHSPAGKEELRAVGIGKFKNKAPSENSIRAEHGETLRTSYPRQN
jgi:hypothetical protein